VFTLLQLQGFVAQFGCRGLSQAEFSRQAKIPVMSFSRWQRRAEGTKPAFARVELSALALGSNSNRTAPLRHR
jgi:hypothetical protein